MFNWIKKQYRYLKQGFKDLKSFKEYKKTIMLEENNANSTYIALKLQHSDNYKIAYKLLNMPPEFEAYADDYRKYQYLIELLKPANYYFENELNWGEYLVFSLYHYENADDPNDLTYTYQAEWTFTPICYGTSKFWALLSISLLISLALLAGIILSI